MEKYIFIILSICFFNYLITPISADCNACNVQSKFACISATEYQQCTNNKPTGTIIQCNPGSYCSIFGTCRDEEELIDCNDCFKCDKSGTFACTGTKSFSLCLGQNTISDIVSQCTGDYVCNIASPQICVLDTPSCSIRDDPTEAPPTPTTTVPSPTTNSTAFCAAMAAEGRYPIGTDPQTTCHQYVNCLRINNEWYGPIYNCPGNTFFDSSKRTCVATQPPTCGAAVSGLSFRGIVFADAYPA